MKKTLLVFCLAFLPIAFFAQEESVSILDKIARETCDYMNNEEVSKLSGNELSTKLGLFIVNLYADYQDELKAEGFEIDFADDGNGAEEFGEKVGITMIKYCPEVLMALADHEAFNEDEVIEVEEFYAEGKLIKLQGDEFSNIIMEDTEGRVQKFLWFTNFAGSDKLIYSDSVEGINVGITYKNTECYSPKLKEYIIRKEILEIIYL